MPDVPWRVDIVEEDESVVVIEELDVEEVEPAEEVELVGESVDTICPVPSKTTPLSWAQQVGSLSQQKLPSLHVLTRGRKPLGDPVTMKVSGPLAPKESGCTIKTEWRAVQVSPWVDLTRWPDQCAILLTESIRITLGEFTAAGVRALTYVIVRILCAVVIVASYITLLSSTLDNYLQEAEQKDVE